MNNNEIFYRVALMRERWQARNPNKPKFPTEHFHVAWVQFRNNLTENYEVIIKNKLGISELKETKKNRSKYNELTKLINSVENSISNALNNFNELF